MSKSSTRKWLLGGAIVAIILIGYFGFFYPWPQTQETSATIGGVEQARRYQADQMSSEDVILSDSQIQTLLQNDQIQALINSQDFIAAMENEASRKALFGEAMRRAMSHEEMRKALLGQNFRKAMSDDVLACLAHGEEDVFHHGLADSRGREGLAHLLS